MMPFDAMEPQWMTFLYELYKRSAGDPRQGVPYEELVEALGFDESLTKRIQCALQQEGLVELTAVPQITNVGRTVMDPAHRQGCRQTIGMTPHGVQLMEDILSNRAHADPPHQSASQSSW
jgi:hypothetical protein